MRFGTSILGLVTGTFLAAAAIGCAGSGDDGAVANAEVVGAKDVKVLGALERLGYTGVAKMTKNYQAFSFVAEANTGFLASIYGEQPEIRILDKDFQPVAEGTLDASSPQKYARVAMETKPGGTYYVAFRDLAPNGRGSSLTVERDFTKATQSKFTCKTQKKFGKRVEEASFTAAFMDRSDIPIDLVPIDEDGRYVATGSGPDAYLEELNENIGFEVNDKMLSINGDADGFYLVELSLYRDSGFKKGFARLRDLGEGVGDQYSEVDCTIETIAPK